MQKKLDNIPAKMILRPNVTLQSLDLTSNQTSLSDLQPVPENKNTQNPNIQNKNITPETQVKKTKKNYRSMYKNDRSIGSKEHESNSAPSVDNLRPSIARSINFPHKNKK